jgi:tetratricopeptide (TPR) repeat protein
MAAGNITNASPGVLDMMLDVAKNRGDTNLAVAVAEATIRDFTETDHALSSRMFLAQVALTRNDYKTAIKHLLVVKEVFASSSEAAEALLMLGDIYVKTGKYPEADDCYKSILAVREWRGPLWPAALYGRADCARLQRKWSAKAYLARSECLAKLGQYKKAAETLEELVANQDLQDQTDVVAEARKKLEDLKTKGI